MIDADMDVVKRELTTFAAIWRVTASPAQIEKQKGVYFRVLQRFRRSAVVSAAAKWREEGDHFPSPHDWISKMPPWRTEPEHPWLTDEERLDVEAARRAGYEADPCSCPECREAGVSHRPLRYVPREDRDEVLVRRVDPRDGQEVILGEWLHGVRLASWWDARATFFAKLQSLGPKAMP